MIIPNPSASARFEWRERVSRLVRWLDAARYAADLRFREQQEWEARCEAAAEEYAFERY